MELDCNKNCILFSFFKILIWWSFKFSFDEFKYLNSSNSSFFILVFLLISLKFDENDVLIILFDNISSIISFKELSRLFSSKRSTNKIFE